MAQRAFRPTVGGLEPRTLLSTAAIEPTAEEQYMLQLINRARANPPAEARRLLAAARTDPALREMARLADLPAFARILARTPARPPLAFNPRLIEAARDHADVGRPPPLLGVDAHARVLQHLDRAQPAGRRIPQRHVQPVPQAVLVVGGQRTKTQHGRKQNRRNAAACSRSLPSASIAYAAALVRPRATSSSDRTCPARGSGRRRIR